MFKRGTLAKRTPFLIYLVLKYQSARVTFDDSNRIRINHPLLAAIILHTSKVVQFVQSRNKDFPGILNSFMLAIVLKVCIWF